MTAQEIEIQALALSKARDKGVNVHDLLQAIAEDPALTAEVRAKAERLRLEAMGLVLDLSGEHERVRKARALSTTCQDAPSLGNPYPPPPPPPAAPPPVPPELLPSVRWRVEFETGTYYTMAPSIDQAITQARAGFGKARVVAAARVDVQP